MFSASNCFTKKSSVNFYSSILFDIWNLFSPSFCIPFTLTEFIAIKKFFMACGMYNRNNIVMYKLNLTLFRSNFVFAVRNKIFV